MQREDYCDSLLLAKVNNVLKSVLEGEIPKGATRKII